MKREKTNKTVTATVLADYFDCSAVYINRLTKKKGMPKQGDRYDLRECTRWYINVLKEEKKGGADSESEVKLRHMEAKASLAEIQLAEKREDLLTVDDAVSTIADTMTTIKSTLMSLPSRLAPQVISGSNASEVEGIAKRIVNEALTELSELPITLQAVKEDAVPLNDNEEIPD